MLTSGVDEVTGPTVPETLMGMPFSVPLLFWRVRTLFAKEKAREGLSSFWPQPENAGLLSVPETAGFVRLPLTAREAVTFPASPYCDESGIRPATRSMSRSLRLAVRSSFGDVRREEALP